MTTTDYLNQLQTDKQTLVDNLIAKGVEATSDETFTTLVSKILEIQNGQSESKITFTGSYDREGLKQIGWFDEEVDYYNEYGVRWDAEDDEIFKLTEEELQEIDNNKGVRFLLKNKDIPLKLNDYRVLLAIPNIDTSEMTDTITMFSNCFALTTIPKLDTSKVTNMGNMFRACYSLTTIPKLDTSNVTNMNNMFYACHALKVIPELNTSNVTSMLEMFRACYSLTTIPKLDTSKVTDMSGMFRECFALTTIPELNTSKVTNMNYMFCDSRALTTIPKLDTSKVTNMGYMFKGCFALTIIPELNTSNVTNMGGIFSACYSLTIIPKLDTSKVTNMGNMFSMCYSLRTIPKLDTSNVTNMGSMFNYCWILSEIPELDCSNVNNISNIFSNCSSRSLKNIKGLKNLGKNYKQKEVNYSQYTLDLHHLDELTKESLLNIINGLYDLNIAYNVTNGGTLYTQTLNLGTTNLARLTEDEIAIATAKGWTVV